MPVATDGRGDCLAHVTTYMEHFIHTHRAQQVEHDRWHEVSLFTNMKMLSRDEREARLRNRSELELDYSNPAYLWEVEDYSSEEKWIVSTLSIRNCCQLITARVTSGERGVHVDAFCMVRDSLEIYPLVEIVYHTNDGPNASKICRQSFMAPYRNKRRIVKLEGISMKHGFSIKLFTKAPLVDLPPFAHDLLE